MLLSLTCADDEKCQEHQLQYNGSDDNIIHSSGVCLTTDLRRRVAVVDVVAIEVVLKYEVQQTCTTSSTSSLNIIIVRYESYEDRDKWRLFARRAANPRIEDG